MTLNGQADVRIDFDIYYLFISHPCEITIQSLVTNTLPKEVLQSYKRYIPLNYLYYRKNIYIDNTIGQTQQQPVLHCVYNIHQGLPRGTDHPFSFSRTVLVP
jgi:hypothetical protein